MTTRRALLSAVLSLLPLAVGCGGSSSPLCAGDPAACSAVGTGGSNAASGSAGGEFRGDGSSTPRFGGWAWGGVPADAVVRAGFDWFETGYPGDTGVNDTLRAGGVRPFAYINLGELVSDLAGESGYNGPILRTNGDWGTQLVDVTNQSWQDWLVRRADYVYQTGSRGVKWDVATPDVPQGKTRDDVNGSIAMVMWRIRQQHPDMKFIFNQGFLFALAHPEFVDGVETEGLFSASSASNAWCAPWNDPWYWGPQFDQAKQVRARGTPIFDAEYYDPWSDQANQLYGAITAQGFVPYITSDHWNVRGRGLDVAPGW